MTFHLGPRATQLLEAWGDVTRSHPTGREYDLTTPTRSERYRNRLATFVDEPTEENFEELWNEQTVAAAGEWPAGIVQNLWSGPLDELATLFDEIRNADRYDDSWEIRVSWSSVLPELYTRADDGLPIVSEQARHGLKKFGIEPPTGFEPRRQQLEAFRDTYLDTAGHVTANESETIPVYEEIDQLFALVTAASSADVAAEATGPRGDLYTALRGYPAASSNDRGPIEIDFEAATPAIDGHVAARKNDAYADTETEHWAGTHYETWKWDFADYVSNTVAPSYDLTELSADDLEPFFDEFWANADEYTDTEILSTPVPQYLLGRWGVVQLQDFQETCFESSEEAAAVLSGLFSEEEHLVDRLERFHDFAESDDVSDGNLLRIATTLLMGAYPDEYVNFQYERFETFFSECSGIDSLETGFDARQYYRIVLACRDLRDGMREEISDASMLDVHTLIRLYQDYLEK